jgi:hypothetical protein
MGRNVFPDMLLRVNDVYQKLKSRGIPDTEIERAILSEFSWGSHWWQQWPPRKTGKFDDLDTIYPSLIPASAFPPYGDKERTSYTERDGTPYGLAVMDQLSTPQSLDNITIGPMTKSQTNERRRGFTSYGANHSGGANRTTDEEADNYTGWGANNIGNPDMRQEPTANGRAMPEELYYPRWQGDSGQNNTLAGANSMGATAPAAFEGQPNAQVPQTFLKEASWNDPTGVDSWNPPKYAKYRYNSHEGDDICNSFNGMVFDLNEISGRPVLPSENQMYVSTHPNCKCTWEMIDPILADQVTPDQMIGSQKEHVQRINRVIGQKSRYGSLHPINSDGSVGDDTISFNPRYSETVKIQEAINELRQQFTWLTPQYVDKIKEQPWQGKFLLVRAASETMTDHRIEGEPYKRLLSGEELHGMARTAVGKGMDINHIPQLKTNAVIMDSEYDPSRKEIQMLVYETDPQILQAIADGVIDSVSINGGPPRTEDVKPCNGDTGELCLHPQGVILGETDGIALTFVVTSPRGLNWRGQLIPPATPGINNTSIEILN